MRNRVLIVDDDAGDRGHLNTILQQMGFHVTAAECGESALSILAAGGRFDAMILDLIMPDLDGLAVLERLQQIPIPPPPVIVQVTPNAVDTVTTALRLGAMDFMEKPGAPARVRACIGNAVKRAALSGEIARMKQARTGTLSLQKLTARAPAMDRVVDLATRATKSALPILIEGEPGTGKEYLAHAIHGSGPRRSKPLVKVNCAGLDADAATAALFGHTRPTLAGGSEKIVGKLRQAQGGTIYLDAIGDLPPPAQERLLSVLSEGRAVPVGEARPVRLDCRIIAAASDRLIDNVSKGLFREDLFYQLNVCPIWLPPLRERPEDIHPLASSFLARFAAEAGKPALSRISAQAGDLLAAHDWPGNITQLENLIYRAVILCRSDLLEPGDFPQLLAVSDPASARARIVSPLLASPDAAPEAAPSAPVARAHDDLPALPIRPPRYRTSEFGVFVDEHGEIRSLDNLEERAIRFALDHYQGRMSEVARRLGIGRSTLYRKLKDYGIDEDRAA